jgi:DNA polymerase III subunit chi
MDAPACEVWFYHLERSSLEQVLPELLERTLARGWRALVRSDDAGRLETLDNLLWTYRDDSFLPHGLAQDPFADHQPVLLSSQTGNPNRANALFVLDGEPGSLDGYERCIVVFDGRAEAALNNARSLWARYKREGRPISYWKQDEVKGWIRQGG